MTAPTTYTQLLQKIQDTCEDDGSEFVAYIPTAVRLAEDKLIKFLDLDDLKEMLSGDLAEGQATITLPSRFLYGHSLTIVTPQGNKSILKSRSPDYLDAYWPNEGVLGVPKYYTKLGLVFKFLPPCDSDLAYRLVCTRRPEYLSSINQTNYFLERAFDLLFGFACAEGYKFLKSSGQASLWETNTMLLVETWNIEQIQKRRDGVETPRNMFNSSNTKKGNQVDGSQA